MKLQVLISEVQSFCPVERCDSLGLVLFFGFFLLAFIVVGLVLVLLLVFKGF